MPVIRAQPHPVHTDAPFEPLYFIRLSGRMNGLLVIGHWSLVIGYWLLVSEYSTIQRKNIAVRWTHEVRFKAPLPERERGLGPPSLYPVDMRKAIANDKGQRTKDKGQTTLTSPCKRGRPPGFQAFREFAPIEIDFVDILKLSEQRQICV